MQVTRTARQQFIDTFGWGGMLWLVGFALGVVAWPFVAVEYIGWIVVPILSLITIGVAYHRFKGSRQPRPYYIAVGVIWLLYPLVLDYLFIVRMFSTQHYYDADVIAYYMVTLLVPIVVGEKHGKDTTSFDSIKG